MKHRKPQHPNAQPWLGATHYLCLDEDFDTAEDNYQLAQAIAAGKVGMSDDGRSSDAVTNAFSLQTAKYRRHQYRHDRKPIDDIWPLTEAERNRYYPPKTRSANQALAESREYVRHIIEEATATFREQLRNSPEMQAWNQRVAKVQVEASRPACP